MEPGTIVLGLALLGAVVVGARHLWAVLRGSDEPPKGSGDSDLGGLLERSRSLGSRKLTGMFYTPLPIVDLIVDEALKPWLGNVERIEEEAGATVAMGMWKELKLIDPACGSGRFLVAACEVLRRSYSEFHNRNPGSAISPSEYDSILLSSVIHGIDIDERAVKVCRLKLRDLLGLGTEISDQILVGDALTGEVRSGSANEAAHLADLESWKWPVNYDSAFPQVFNSGVQREIRRRTKAEGSSTGRDGWNYNDPYVVEIPVTLDSPESSGGFDVVVMNPPYGKLRHEKKAWASQEVEDEEAAKRRFENLRRYLRSSGMYPNSTGVLNWYKLFIERALAISKEGGSVGFIVPSTLMCDKTATKLRKMLLERNLTHMYHISEKNDFFKDVTQSYCIGVLINSGDYKATKFCYKLSSIKRDLGAQEVDLRAVAAELPELLPFPLTGVKGMGLFRKLHGRFPVLSSLDQIVNRRGEVDLTASRAHLRMDPDGHRRVLRGNSVGFYRIDRLESNPRTVKANFIDSAAFLEQLGNSEKSSHIGMERLVGKQIANQNNDDRVQFALTEPGSILGNSLNYVMWQGSDPKRWNRILLGLLNSTLVDWVFRITSTNNHVNNYEIDSLPVPINSDSPEISESLRKVGEVSEMMGSCDDNQLESLRDMLDAEVCLAYGLDSGEKWLFEEAGYSSKRILRITSAMAGNGVRNHVTSSLGEFERSFLRHIPPGGNWKDIPPEIQDSRIDSIRATGGRTTYYGRLHPERPAYTISTYFSRTGNGCFIHPEQDRLISQREAARLQSFPDDFVFRGPKTSIYKQIGNAVPPLLARAFGELLQPETFVDLFAGAGGLSRGLEMAGESACWR